MTNKRKRPFQETQAPSFVQFLNDKLLAKNNNEIKDNKIRKQIIQKLLCMYDGFNDQLLINLYENEFANKPIVIHTINLDSCSSCNIPLQKGVDSNCILYCPECGHETRQLDSSISSVAYGDDVEYTPYNCKKNNQLREWLANLLQKKKKKKLPENQYGIVIPAVLECLLQQGIEQSSQISFATVKKALKTLKYKKYYDMCFYIWEEVTGQPKLDIDENFLEKIHLMSRKMEPLLETYGSFSKRKLSACYSYLVFKFCQLLGREDLLTCFVLPKAEQKLIELETIFAEICQKVNWKFIPIPLSFIDRS